MKDRTTEKSLVIPELEEMAKDYTPKSWTDKQVKTLALYYNRVPIRSLAKHIGKTPTACQCKAQALGLAGRGK